LEGPTLDDVISMLVEDVIGEALLARSRVRRHRSLREAHINHAVTSHSPLKARRNARGHRALRRTHPSAVHLHRPAPRAAHLRHNRFTRPRRRLQNSVVSALLDSLSITGGYDGSQIFFKLEMDISKEAVQDLEELILKPIRLLSETDFASDMSMLFSLDGSSQSSFDLAADIGFSASAHLGATGEYITNIFQCTMMQQQLNVANF
jgi:hypothetical protein